MLPTGTVTFLFTDIQGSTPLWERAPEKMTEALQLHNTALRQAVQSNDGVVFKIVGDSFQAAFTTAPQALKAAVEGQRRLQSVPWNELGELKVRMGLHTGEAKLDPGGDEYAVSHTKNRAARIMSAANGGQILLSQECMELVKRVLPEGVTLKDLGEHRLKGMAYPEHLIQVLAVGLEDNFQAITTQTEPMHNLPRQLTRLINRRTEIAEVKALLSSFSLVSLTGSGGVGKTRLSIQVAEEMLDFFPHGIWYVELAPISDPALVSRTVARELGIMEESKRSIEETLTLFLHSRQLMIVLDNCEHLMSACIKLTNLLLHACPKVKILVSSREALGVEGERTYRVPSLQVPDPRQAASPEVIQGAEAVILFVERARAVLPSFQVTAQNAAPIARICQRLDGIPLAIELAASRLNLLTTEQIAVRLDKAFRLLTGGSRTALPRQQTLRAAIDWSYQLLTQPERLLLCRLAVFMGGCELEAVEEVCSGNGLDPEDILDLLTNLVKKSVVLADRIQGKETRFQLLETVRQYAREKLFDAGDSERLRDRHLDYFLRFAEKAEPNLYSHGRLEWTRRLNSELDNIRVAIDWSYTGKEELGAGLRIATAIGRRFMQPTGLFKEAQGWINYALESQSGSELPALVRIRALNVLSWLGSTEMWTSVRKPLEECVRLCRALGSSADLELSWALWGLANAVRFQTGSVFQEAMDHANESVSIARNLPSTPLNLWYLAFALEGRAHIQNGLPGLEDKCQRDAEESYQLFLQAGDRWSAGTLWFLGEIAMNQGNLNQAQELFEETLNLFNEAEDKNGAAISSGYLTLLFIRQQDYRKAFLYLRNYINDVYAISSLELVMMGLDAAAYMLIHYASRQDQPRSEIQLEQAAVLVGALGKLGRDEYKKNFVQPADMNILLSHMTEEGVNLAQRRGCGMDLEQAILYVIDCLDEGLAEFGKDG